MAICPHCQTAFDTESICLVCGAPLTEHTSTIRATPPPAEEDAWQGESEDQQPKPHYRLPEPRVEKRWDRAFARTGFKVGWIGAWLLAAITLAERNDHAAPGESGVMALVLFLAAPIFGALGAYFSALVIAPLAEFATGLLWHRKHGGVEMPDDAAGHTLGEARNDSDVTAVSPETNIQSREGDKDRQRLPEADL